MVTRRGEPPSALSRLAIARGSNTMTPEQVLEAVRDYLSDSFPTVDIAADPDGRTGSRFLYVREGSTRKVVELTQRFLDADGDLPHPLAAVRKWDLAGVIKAARTGAVVVVTSGGVSTAR
jgi:hypothetical protein